MCYALGLDPADTANDFRIVPTEMVDGKPKVEWEPKVNRWTGAEARHPIAPPRWWLSQSTTILLERGARANPTLKLSNY